MRQTTLPLLLVFIKSGMNYFYHTFFTASSGSENDLYNKLFAKYNNNVRPQTNGISITNVTIVPTLFHLLSIVR